MKHLESAREVIAALGGLDAVAELTGRKYVTVSHWQTKAKRFPAATYVLLMRELAALGYTAPASLWNLMEVAHA